MDIMFSNVGGSYNSEFYTLCSYWFLFRSIAHHISQKTDFLFFYDLHNVCNIAVEHLTYFHKNFCTDIFITP